MAHDGRLSMPHPGASPPRRPRGHGRWRSRVRRSRRVAEDCQVTPALTPVVRDGGQKAGLDDERGVQHENEGQSGVRFRPATGAGRLRGLACGSMTDTTPCSARSAIPPMPPSSPPSRRWSATAPTAHLARINVLDFAAERGLDEEKAIARVPARVAARPVRAELERALPGLRRRARRQPAAQVGAQGGVRLRAVLARPTSRRSTRWSRSPSR